MNCNSCGRMPHTSKTILSACSETGGSLYVSRSLSEVRNVKPTEVMNEMPKMRLRGHSGDGYCTQLQARVNQQEVHGGQSQEGGESPW